MVSAQKYLSMLGSFACFFVVCRYLDQFLCGMMEEDMNDMGTIM